MLLIEQELSVDEGIYNVPRKDLILTALSVVIKRFQSLSVSESKLRGAGFKCVLPQLRSEMFSSCVESASALPGFLKDSAGPSVTPGKDSLKIAGYCFVVIEGNSLDVKSGGQVVVLLDEVLRSVLSLPLERRVSLRHKVGNTDCNPESASLSAADLIIDVHYLSGDFSDSVQILQGLSRKSYHEVKLYVLPSELNRLTDSAVYIIFRNVLVNNVSQPLRTGFRRECEPGLAVTLYLVENLEREGSERATFWALQRPISSVARSSNSE